MGHSDNQLTTRPDATFEECDHNQYGDASLQIMLRLYAGDSATYTSLSTWQASGELLDGSSPGGGSLASDPVFSNGSGSMIQLEDFRLEAGSPCVGSGRNAGNMGANIDLVGIQ